jgi:hypothetical protein
MCRDIGFNGKTFVFKGDIVGNYGNGCYLEKANKRYVF